MQPTYDWTCFSHSLLNVSPMPVESSPPLPCPTPCHLLPNCTSCLASKGADGGWQHCVWSSSLQQVMAASCCPAQCPLLPSFPSSSLSSSLLPLVLFSFPCLPCLLLLWSQLCTPSRMSGSFSRPSETLPGRAGKDLHTWWARTLIVWGLEL